MYNQMIIKEPETVQLKDLKKGDKFLIEHDLWVHTGLNGEQVFATLIKTGTHVPMRIHDEVTKVNKIAVDIFT